MNLEPHHIVQVAWFDEAQWLLLCTLVPDRSELDDTFEQWQQSALKTVRMLESRGQTVERFPVDVLALSAWCRDRNLPLTGESRAMYVADVSRWQPRLATDSRQD